LVKDDVAGKSLVAQSALWYVLLPFPFMRLGEEAVEEGEVVTIRAGELHLEAEGREG
jgi:hypothetical protein